MYRPRIIIADIDGNYILPLQLHFIQEFFERIDLEIITDKEYFRNCFASPQKAEILIVSEDMFDPSLLKHNIGIVFLMTEQSFGEDSAGTQNVNRIFKYTNDREIFNEIKAKSKEIIRIDSVKKIEPQIVLVYSATGGTGKTTIALGVASCLAQSYKRVLYINASWLQSFQWMLKDDDLISTNEVYTKLMKATDNIYEEIKHVLREETFTYLPPFRASLMSLGLDYSIYEKIALSAKESKDFDYVIVDADSEFDEEKASLIAIADKVVIVTNQNAASIYATNILVSNINGISAEKYAFICNDFIKNEDNAATAMSTKFQINEYVEHIDNYDELKADWLSSINGIKNVSILVE